MKKVFLFALATAMMSFAGCQQMEQEAPVNPNEGGSTFEFVADIAHTKTTLDVANGYKVDWEEGDLIYMVTSDGTWGKPYNDDKNAETIAEFTYAESKFTSEATIADGKYIFKGMYAAASQKSFHRGASSTHKLEATQAQDCANPTAHIKANDALVGTFTATVPMTEMAKMNMSHLYTLMQVNVNNATGAAVNVTKFEMTASGADLAGVFNVTAFDTPALTTKQNATSTITVNVTGGSVDNNASLPVYFVMAPLSNYAGDVTFKVTDSEGKTYTKTVTMNGISFEAGKYNTTPYTIKEADVVEPEPEGVVTATISFATAEQRTYFSTEEQVWENDGVVFTNTKTTESTAVVENVNPVRLYKNSEISIAANGYITKIDFICNSSDYATSLKNSISGSTLNGKTVSLALDGTSDAVSYVLTDAQVRLDGLTVIYSTEGYVAKTLESIAVSGDYKSEFTQGDDFSFGGVITAIYSDESTKTIAEKDCTFSGYNMEAVGEQKVTVTYDGKTTTYIITVSEAQSGEDESGWVSTAFADLKDGDQVVIVSTKSSDIYAMSNNNGTGSAPEAVAITYANDKLTTEPDAKVIWYVGVSGDKRIFYSNSGKTKWMYCTNSNNGVRVGDNTNNTFVLDASGYLKHDGTSRYLGVYNNKDWRCYTTVNNNITGQTFKFFVKSSNTGGSGETTDPTPDPEPENPGEGGGENPTPEQPSSGSAIEFTFTSSDAVTKDGVTVTFAKGSGQNDPVWNNSSNHLRLYAYNTIVVSAPAKTITKIEYVFTKQGSKDYATASGGTSYTSGGISTSSTDPKTDTWIGTVTNSSVTVTLGSSGQRVIKSIKVYTN